LDHFQPFKWPLDPGLLQTQEEHEKHDRIYLWLECLQIDTDSGLVKLTGEINQNHSQGTEPDSLKPSHKFSKQVMVDETVTDEENSDPN
jgi:hypothetical protein